jgi:hypothetical protein
VRRHGACLSGLLPVAELEQYTGTSLADICEQCQASPRGADPDFLHTAPWAATRRVWLVYDVRTRANAIGRTKLRRSRTGCCRTQFGAVDLALTEKSLPSRPLQLLLELKHTSEACGRPRRGICPVALVFSRRSSR